ncbi:MAG: hypothetical protein LUE17_06760 [Planctomycetaceae bacterium]|nr:hypothetical protein [Planctomycetaceae bacterium]
MAFEHPHKLELKRTTTVKGRRFSDVPFVRDRRGKIIYRWDAHYAGMSDEDLKRNDLWELVEHLDAKRLERQRLQAAIDRRDRERLAKLMAAVEAAGQPEEDKAIVSNGR